MMDFFRKLFKSIFGNKESETNETVDSTQGTTSNSQTETPKVEEPNTSEPEIKTEPKVEEKTEEVRPPDPKITVENGHTDVSETPPVKASNNKSYSVINPEIEANLDITTEDGKIAIDIKRFDTGEADILGKLYLNGEFTCYTMENSASGGSVPVGEYEISLSTTGGRHATYQFRFKDIHKGMLKLKGSDAIFHIGNQAIDAQGSILVGQEIIQKDHQNSREIWKSDLAYFAFYSKVINEINAGKTAIVRIS